MQGMNFRSMIIMMTLCLVSLAGAQYTGFEYSEDEAKLYRIDIDPITPKEGITTGHVIAYGHYIKPPYRVEVKIVDNDTAVYINNVKVCPTIRFPGLKPCTTGMSTSEYSDKLSKFYAKYIALRENAALDQSIVIIDSLIKKWYDSLGISLGDIRGKTINIILHATYWRFRKFHDIDKATMMLTDFARDSLGLKDAKTTEFAYAKGISYTWQGMGRIIGIETPSEIAESLRVHRERGRKEFFERYSQHYQKALSENTLLIFGYQICREDPHFFHFDAILRIMKSAIGIPEKAHQLYDVIDLPSELVKEIIYNFDSNEYPELKEEK